jgi:hypothetical protein
MKDIQISCVFSISCQRLQSCSLEVSEVFESSVWMPDQSIYSNREVQIGTNRYFMLRRMVIFGTFMVHIGKTRMKPSFFRLYWVEKEQNKG